MQKIPKQEYTAELKEQAVKRVKDGETVGAVAKETGRAERDGEGHTR
jgi:transposase